MGLTVASVLAGLVAMAILFKPFFQDFAGFSESLGCLFARRFFPDEDEIWDSMKLYVWVLVGISVGCTTHRLLSGVL